MKTKKKEPSNVEMQVLSVLWERGPSTVREVLEALPDGKSRAYTTVLTVMQVMEKKGFLDHTTKGNMHVYEPKVSQSQALGPLLRNLVKNLFGGSPSTAMQHLLAENEVTPAELQRLKALIERQESAETTSKKKGGTK